MYEFLVIYCIWVDDAHDRYRYEETKLYSDNMRGAQEGARLYAKAHGYALRGLDIYRLGVNRYAKV